MILIEIYSQLLVNGILFGTMYGIAAIGLSLIFGTMRILFVAQGAILILASYFSFWAFRLFSIDPYISLIIVIPLFIFIGWLIYHGLFRKVTRAGSGATLLVAFGLMILLQSLMVVFWGADVRAIRTEYTSFGFKFLGLRLSFTRTMAFIMAVISAVGVSLFLKRTLMGKAVRAASENLEFVTLRGIKPHWISGIAFCIGLGLAGVAGVAYATAYAFDPYTGFLFTLKALIAVAIGGMGNILGALLGGILLGVLESLGSFTIGAGWSEALGYAIFLMVLMFRPQGLFSRSSSSLGNSAEPVANLATENQPLMSQFNALTKRQLSISSLILACLCLVPFILNSETSYLVNLLFLIFIYVALTLSWNIIGGYAGQMSLGHHAFFGLGAYITGLIWVNDLIGTGYYFDPVTMFLSGLGPAVLAVLIGIPLLSRLRGDYFALGTLGLAEILRVVFTRGGTITGGSLGLQLPAGMYTSMKPYYFTALFLVILAILCSYFLIKSRTGLAITALREDELAASASGVDVLRFKIIAFALSAFIAGLCGSLMAYHLFQIHPRGIFSVNWVLYPILMCMLGGTGTIIGPIIGAVFLTVLFEQANIYLPEIHPIFSGLIVILIIVFMPNGLIRLRLRGFFKKAGSFSLRQKIQ